MWGFNVWTALRIAFVDLGVSLPARAVESAQTIQSHAALGVTAVVFVVVLAWMVHRSAQSRHAFTRTGAVTWVAVGFVLFLLGWVVFLASSRVQLTATGIGNRTAGAAALGVGVLFLGVFELVTTLAPRRRQPMVFALLTALTSACSLLIVYRVAEDWGRAWTSNREVVGQIHARFPSGFSGKTLLLDGVCQYIGPASVFEASWDLEWSLQAEYGDPTIRAEVVTPNLELRDQHLRTTAYGEEKLYPYRSTILYRPADDVVRTIDSRADAEAFFEAYDFDRSGGCPQGRIGHGVDIFTPTGELRYVSGFYPPEQATNRRAWRWMSGLGVVSLPNTHRDMVLTIRADVPAQLAPPHPVRITFNGRVIDQIDGLREINKSYTLNAAAQGTSRSSELRIATGKTFTPAELDAHSADQRRLALVVYDISWK